MVVWVGWWRWPGALGVLVASFLPWGRSGGASRNSYELLDAAGRLEVVSVTVTASTDPQQLPIGPTLSKLLGHFDAEPDFEATTTTEDLAGDAPMIVALDEGDGWHASLFYTVAEGMRREAGEPVPAFGDGVEAAGADSSETAVRQAVEAAVDLDARRLIGLVSPSEAAALHDYARLFLDDAEAAVADLRAEVPYEVDVTRLDLSSETDGDVAQVRLGDFEASGTVPDLGRFSVSYDGDCFTFEADVEADTTCASDLPQSGFGGPDTQMVVTTVRDDGQWYLSPTRTLFQPVLSALRALDRDDLEDPESLFGPFFGAGLGLAFAEGGDPPRGRRTTRGTRRRSTTASTICGTTELTRWRLMVVSPVRAERGLARHRPSLSGLCRLHCVT